MNECRYSMKRTAPSHRTLWPVHLDEVKQELDIVDDDTVNERLGRMIREAVDQVERDSRRVMMTQTWQMHMDEFPCGPIGWRKCPLQTVTHVKYYTGGVLTTLSPSLYTVDAVSEPSRIVSLHGTPWPWTDCRPNAVQIECVVGYESWLVVPDYIKSVVLSVIRAKYYGCSIDEGVYRPLIERLQTFGVAY